MINLTKLEFEFKGESKLRGLGGFKECFKPGSSITVRLYTGTDQVIMYRMNDLQVEIVFSGNITSEEDFQTIYDSVQSYQNFKNDKSESDSEGVQERA